MKKATIAAKKHSKQYRHSATPHRKIFIIDDDIILLEELRELFEAKGFKVFAFTDSNFDLKRVGRLQPDLILLDLKMDRKSGFQIAYEIKRSYANALIVGMTGVYRENRHFGLMRVCGIKSCIIKSLEPKAIFEKLGDILAERRFEMVAVN